MRSNAAVRGALSALLDMLHEVRDAIRLLGILLLNVEVQFDI